MVRRRGGATLTLLVGLMLAISGAPAHAATQPYGTGDAGGFRNVLPPGENGLVTAPGLVQNQLTGARPAHFDDQLGLYTGLANAADTLTHDQIPNYFKDATFGVRPGDVASTEFPRGDVTIVRDRSYGVPHVYGTTRSGVEFGAGYAGAEDRLFLMDILRHTGRAELSSFAGGAAGNRAMDRTQWSLAPYTEADLQSQVDNAPRLYGAAGQRIISDATDYVAGINTYISATRLDPTKLPGEYAAFAKTPQPWTVTDVIAEASLIGGIFGKGGGAQVRSALTEEAFQRHFGAAAGRASWSDFRSKNDPEAPTTLSQPFPYADNSPFSPRGLAMPDAGSVSFISSGPPLGGTGRSSPRAQSGRSSVGAARQGAGSGASAGRTATPARLAIPNDGSIGAQLLQSLRGGSPLASNWELVPARNSANGHAIAVMGPQVGYYVPQILLEEDLHGPGIDARGASFPGVNQYVELGHGRDYAWSATTATTQNVDTFAEVLCNPDGSPPAAGADHYRYRGQCLAMETLNRSNSWTPNASDKTPPGSETLTVQRTVHGIVIARGTVNGGTPVAFVSSRTSYFHEADSALGFSEFNDPGFITSPQQFQKAAGDMNFGFNWAYVDASHIAYYHSGLYPQRSDGVSPDFPVLGTGEYDWKGYDPSLHTLDPLPFAAHPNAIDPTYLVSWNNKQAPQWSAADDKYAFGPVYRSQMIEAGIKRALAGGGKMRTEQLISAMDEAATTDVRCFALWPIIKQALGQPTDPGLQGAVSVLDRWYADGCHRRDLTNHDNTKAGVYQHNDAITIMDAWYPKLVDAEFRPALGDEVMGQLTGMLGFGDIAAGSPPGSYPSFSDGWYGYVSKDLRDVLGSAHRVSSTPATRVRCRRVRRRVRRHGHTVVRTVRRCGRSHPRHHRHHRRARGHRSSTTRLGHRRPHRLRPAAAKSAGGVLGGYSRLYCGGGSLTACRQVLQSTLRQALAVTPAQIYGNGRCASNPQASCYDMDRSVIASAESIPPFPFQNRPTFQQVVELTQTLGR